MKPQASAGAVSLPKGGGALSGLGETFTPDLHTGTGSFSVPIGVPPGRGGVQPQLQLTYSSGGGNGPFGLGWAVTVPSVARKTSRGVPRYNERRSQDLLDASGERRDTFVASADDLVRVGGSYPGRMVYRPQTERAFARIVHHQAADAGDWWEVADTNGMVSRFGTPLPDRGDSLDAAAVFDPAAPTRIAAWRITETVDPFGNRVVYRYRGDGLVDPQSGSTPPGGQRYLSEIRYVEAPEAPDRFFVSVAFEYESRPDASSDHRAGFELRTRLRCNSITMRTHGDEDRVVRSYRLGYSNHAANGSSLLTSIVVVGPLDGGPEESFPPLELDYTEFDPTAHRFRVVQGSALPGTSLANPNLELIDLFGSGLPDILELDGQPRYWRNLGWGRFDRPRTMAVTPGGQRLADRGVQLLDADGDGRTDLLISNEAGAGYFPLRAEANVDQRSFVRYRQAPSVSLEDPDVRLLDLDGDGFTDILRSGDRFVCYFNDSDPARAWQRTSVVARARLADFPDVSFTDPRVKLADMTGDGLTDIVYVHNRAIEYWPNLGHGTWGARRRIVGGPDLPVGYDPARLLIGDVDGDGAADLLYVDDGQVTLWLNQAGEAWGSPTTIRGTPSVTDVTSLRLVDLLGTGVAGLLWSRDDDGTGQNLRFLDFTGGVKPYLLDRIVNNLGAQTAIGYRPSTVDYLRDHDDPAMRWETPLPFPVQVVGSVDVVDVFSNNQVTTQFRYHQGLWDGRKHEFRGFGFVEQVDTARQDDPPTGRLHAPQVLTRTWFHQGEPRGRRPGDAGGPRRSWPGDPPRLSAVSQSAGLQPDRLPAAPRRAALRALRGLLLRSEVYGLDGTGYEHAPFTVVEHSYAVHAVVDAGTAEAAAQLVDDPALLPPAWTGRDAEGVFFPCVVATRTTQWERGDDPMTSMQFAAGHDGLGRPRHATAVTLPRRSRSRHPVVGAVVGGVEPDQTNILAVHTQTLYAQPLPSGGAGVPRHLHDRVAQIHHFELDDPPGVTESSPNDLNEILAAQVSAAAATHRHFVEEVDGWQPGTPPAAGMRLVGHTVNHYDGPAFEGLDPGSVEHGALVRVESLVADDRTWDAAYADLQGSRRPSYLNGPLAPPPGAPSDFGRRHGYRRHQAAEPPYQPGCYYANVMSRRFDFQTTGPAPHGLARWPSQGVVVGTRDALGNPPTTTIPDPWWLLTERVIDPAGLETRISYHPSLLLPVAVTSANATVTHQRYNGLGLPTASWLQAADASEGGTSEDPDTIHTYDLHAYRRSREGGSRTPQPVHVHTSRRVRHASEPDGGELIQCRDYSDGFGRLLQTRSQADDLAFGGAGDEVGLSFDHQGGDSPAVGDRRGDRVIVSGFQVYDNKGRVIRRYEPYFSLGWDYQPGSEQTSAIVVDLFYDPRGNLIRTVNPDGSQHLVVYGRPRQPTELQIDATDLDRMPDRFVPTPWETYTYDGNDLAPVSIDPADPTAARTLADRADPSHYFTPASSLVDGLGRTICTVVRNGADPARDWHVERFSYDARGNLTGVTDALGRTAFSYVYDLLNRPLRVDGIDGGLRTNVLDASGNLLEHRDSNGGVVLREYDPLNRLVRLRARNSRDTDRVTVRETIDYGDAGTPDQPEADRADNRLRRRLGRPSRHRDEAGQLDLDRYDLHGNIASKTRLAVSDATLASLPDDADWVVDWDQEDPGETLDQDTPYRTDSQYDALGRLSAVTLPTDVQGNRSTIRLVHTRANALLSLTLDDQPFVELIAYDAKGQRVLVQHGNGLVTRYLYDPRTLRLRRARTEGLGEPPADDRWVGNGRPHEDVVYTRDLIGNPTRVEERVAGCGIRNDPAAAAESDPVLRRLLTEGNALVRRLTYDPSYRLTSSTGRACQLPRSIDDVPGWGGYQTTAPVPDQRNAPFLTEAYSETYRYDPAGNLLELGYSTTSDRRLRRRFGIGGRAPEDWAASPDNQVSSLTVGQTVQTYRFDPNGNLVAQNSERVYTWDHADRMIGFSVRAGTTVTLRARYLYGADGSRVKKWVRRAAVSESTTYVDREFEHHRWASASNTIHVFDSAARLGLRNVGPRRPDDLGPQTQFHHADQLGNCVLVTDDTGTWVNREEYFAYGETSLGSFARKRYRYAGKERDEESGLSYFQARYYACWLGRWTSGDPREHADGHNAYVYVRDSPLHLVDVSGASAAEVLREAAEHTPEVIVVAKVALRVVPAGAAASTAGGAGATAGGAATTAGGVALGTVAAVAALAVIAAAGFGIAAWAIFIERPRRLAEIERMRAESERMRQHLAQQVEQAWRNGFITQEEYDLYRATGVLVIQPRSSGSSGREAEARSPRTSGKRVPGLADQPSSPTKAPGANVLRVREYRPSLKDKNRPIQRHEVLQNAFLEAIGKVVGRRGVGYSGYNTVLEAPTDFHQEINRLQREAGLHDTEKLAQMSALEVIERNLEVLEKAGLPPELIKRIWEDVAELLPGLGPRAFERAPTPNMGVKK
jgi:RHS repeat-associated protein